MEEALESSEKEQWQKAISKKVKTIENNSVWTKAAMPPGKTAAQRRTVFERKLGDKRKVCRFKSRLMANGSLQKESY